MIPIHYCECAEPIPYQPLSGPMRCKSCFKVMQMNICGRCGSRIAIAKSGRLVHLDEIPKGVDPDHEIAATTESDYAAQYDYRFTLKGAAEDMLAHHATLHPSSECEWAVLLRRALRSA